MADRYPKELEFYVPQLCTYLFHFTTDGGPEKDSFVMIDHPMPEGPGTQIVEETKQGIDHKTEDPGSPRTLLKEFLLERSNKSTQFAHMVFWYVVASIDDSESIQMSQHNNKEMWSFLEQLLITCEEQLTTQTNEQFKKLEAEKTSSELVVIDTP